MSKTKKFLISIFILLVLAMPVLSFADGLVPCNDSNCGFGDLLKLINNVISFILKDLAVPIAALMFFYAGILLITAGGGEAKTKAKAIFTNTLIGLFFIAGCWLIINTLLGILGFDGSWIGF